MAVAGTALFTSCSKDNNNDSGHHVTAITLTSNIDSVELGSGSFTFMVADQDGNDLTADSDITVNDVAIDGSTWEPTEAGTFNVVATYGDFTSNTVTVTVTTPVPTPDNSVVMGTDSYPTDQSILAYLGTDTSAGLSYWVANAYNQEGDGDSATYPNDEYIYFTTPQTSTTDIDFPTTGSYVFGDDATANSIFNVEINIDGTNYADDTTLATDASMTINDFQMGDGSDPATQTWSYDYSVTLANGDVINGNFNGQWGFYNATGGRQAARTANNTFAVKSLSKAQIAQVKAQFLASRK